MGSKTNGIDINAKLNPKGEDACNLWVRLDAPDESIERAIDLTISTVKFLSSIAQQKDLDLNIFGWLGRGAMIAHKIRPIVPDIAEFRPMQQFYELAKFIQDKADTGFIDALALLCGTLNDQFYEKIDTLLNAQVH